MPAILVHHGRRDPLVLEVEYGGRAVELSGPPGARDAAAAEMVRAALEAPPEGPPLAAHAVPGDRVTLALAGPVPQATAVIAALREALAAVVAESGDVPQVVAAPGTALPPGAVPFDPRAEGDAAYLAADDGGRPLYLARKLVDADLVVEVAPCRWDAALRELDPSAALWPAFGRAGSVAALQRRLARRGRAALPAWNTTVERIRWQLGVIACLRLVPGRAGSLHAACFGPPEAATAAARARALAWRPVVDAPAPLAVATLSASGTGMAAFTRAVAAAARVTTPGGTICVVGDVAPPGPVFRRWREGAPLRPLVAEALAGGDPDLYADAVQARLFARALGTRRVVLLSGLDDALVDELDFGNARTPEAVERLAARSAELVVLHEADLLWPRRRRPGG